MPKPTITMKRDVKRIAILGFLRFKGGNSQSTDSFDAAGVRRAPSAIIIEVRPACQTTRRIGGLIQRGPRVQGILLPG